MQLPDDGRRDLSLPPGLAPARALAPAAGDARLIGGAARTRPAITATATATDRALRPTPSIRK